MSTTSPLTNRPPWLQFAMTAHDIDDLLVAFAEQQRLAGRRVLGLVMKHRDRGEGCKAAMVLTDIDTGDEYRFAGAGSGSTSCSADPQGFARASRSFAMHLTEDRIWSSAIDSGRLKRRTEASLPNCWPSWSKASPCDRGGTGPLRRLAAIHRWSTPTARRPRCVDCVARRCAVATSRPELSRTL